MQATNGSLDLFISCDAPFKGRHPLFPQNEDDTAMLPHVRQFQEYFLGYLRELQSQSSVLSILVYPVQLWTVAASVSGAPPFQLFSRPCNWLETFSGDTKLWTSLNIFEHLEGSLGRESFKVCKNGPRRRKKRTIVIRPAFHTWWMASGRLLCSVLSGNRNCRSRNVHIRLG